MFNFLQAYHPQPILMKIGPFEVHWYGFLMVIGGLVGLVVILSLVKRFDIEKGDVGALRATPLRPLFHDLLLYFVIGAVIGARVYYVLYAWEMYRGNWFDVLKIWQGGLAILRRGPDPPRFCRARAHRRRALSSCSSAFKSSP